MPVTPFHFGAGLLAKGLLPRQVSFLAFVVSQVVIDCETAYFLMVKHEWPFHRWAHTLAVGAVVGVVAGLATSLMARAWVRRNERTWQVPDLREAALMPSLVGGLFGGVSHSILDALMHDDLKPFLPFSAANPFLGAVSLLVLHLTLVVAGGLGIALLFYRGVDSFSVPR